VQERAKRDEEAAVSVERDWEEVKRRLSRRRLLGLGGAGAATLALGFRPLAERAVANPRFSGNPFTLGVASGDPLPHGVVLWTRLAPEPLEPFGGMPDRRVPVRWELASDEGMRRVVQRGQLFARPQLAHSVHAEVAGLEPGREYYYRFRAGREESPVGRTRTAPARGAAVGGLAFAFASCQHYPSGYFTPYRHMAEEDLDLVVHLGDYIYEGAEQGSLSRGHAPARGLQTLDDYRVRLAQYKTDPDLQSAHARFPWLVTWDDHEVVNNYADEIDGVPPEDFLVQRANAYRAYYEHMPLRRLRKPDGPDLPLYRRFAFGDLAEFNVLDTRQYRDDQVRGDERLAPSRTLTGEAQERWLLDGLGRSRATWNVLAQQVFFSQLDLAPGAEESFNTDAWDGYVASRDRILSGIVERDVRNPIVLTGDVHRHYASNIKADFDDPDSATLASEFVGTSISSFGDGSEDDQATALLAENPHVEYYRNLRGYVRCELTPTQWRTDYKVVPYITRPGAPVRTDASFVVESDNPGLQRA